MTEKKPWKSIVAFVDPNYVGTVGLGQTIHDVADKHDVEVKIFKSFSELTADDYVKMVLLIVDSRASGANGSEFFGKFAKYSEQFSGLQLANGMAAQHPSFPIVVLDKHNDLARVNIRDGVEVIRSLDQDGLKLISDILEKKLRELTPLAEKRNSAAGQASTPDSTSR